MTNSGVPRGIQEVCFFLSVQLWLRSGFVWLPSSEGDKARTAKRNTEREETTEPHEKKDWIDGSDWSDQVGAALLIKIRYQQSQSSAFK